MYQTVNEFQPELGPPRYTLVFGFFVLVGVIALGIGGYYAVNYFLTRVGEPERVLPLVRDDFVPSGMRVLREFSVDLSPEEPNEVVFAYGAPRDATEGFKIVSYSRVQSWIESAHEVKSSNSPDSYTFGSVSKENTNALFLERRYQSGPVKSNWSLFVFHEGSLREIKGEEFRAAALLGSTVTYRGIGRARVIDNKIVETLPDATSGSVFEITYRFNGETLEIESARQISLSLPKE